ncbi:MAG: tripartite tricarboxylate transporter substrate binding protein [Faecousia sp.]
MKKLIAIVLACVLVLSLAACGGSGSTSTSSNSSSSSSSAFQTSSTWAPTGTVSLILPAGAGGDTDLTCRVFTQYAKQLTGVDFVVVNASGASGSVAAEQVLSAANDGMTALYGHTLVNVANIAGVTDYNYTAFTLGPNFAKNPAQQLYVSAKKYPNGLEDFIAAAKANPGKLQACTEVGAYTYYELLAFEKAAGIDLDLVDVGSNSDKIAAMLGGQVDLMPGAWMSIKDYVASGDFICIGAPTADSYEMLTSAGVKTFAEQNVDLVYPDLDYSFYFPKDTDPQIIQYYDDLVKAVLDLPECQQTLVDMDVIPCYMTSAQCADNEANLYETMKSIADSL